MTVESQGAIAGVAVMTPPRGLVLAYGLAPGAVEALARHLHPSAVPSVLGPRDAVAEFANLWRRLRGVPSREGMRQGIYELRSVVHPHYSPGRLRQAVWDELSLLAQWRSQFIAEAGAFPETPEQNRRAAEALLAEGTAYLWDDGGPVSVAVAANPTPRGMRVGLVYTPPQRRKRGYATSCVAALSQQLLDSGREFCCLFADLANPTSNHIYQEIGYRLVCEWDEAIFEG